MSRRVTVTIGLALLLLSAVTGLRAEMVQNLYSAEVPVADQSSAALSKAARLALSEVLVKVTGNAGVLREPTIAAALDQARTQVQQYVYRREQPPADGLRVRLEFDSSYITGLVVTAGLPLWTANRPVVLLWLVRDGPEGRQFITPDTAPELVAQLRDEFARRGVPLQLPLFDLADASRLPVDVAWSLDAPALLDASARYKSQAVLAGRLADLSSGGVAGDWLFLLGNERTGQVLTVPDEPAFVRDGVKLAAETMAARYAVAATGAEAEGVAMSIAGVSTYADYSAIINWLESLELVERANVEWVRGEVLHLRLLAQADAAQLATIIELNKRLVPLSGDPQAELLNYQWQQ